MKIDEIITEASDNFNPGRRKFMQRTAGAAAMAAAPQQAMKSLGQMATASQAGAKLKILGAALLQAVKSHHDSYGAEVKPWPEDDDDFTDVRDSTGQYWDGSGQDWIPKDGGESPWQDDVRVSKTPAGRDFVEASAGPSGDQILLSFFTDTGKPAWARIEYLGPGEFQVQDVNVPGKKVDIGNVQDILAQGFDKGWTKDEDETDDDYDEDSPYVFEPYDRADKDIEFLIDMLATGSTSSNHGKRFAKKNPQWLKFNKSSGQSSAPAPSATSNIVSNVASNVASNVPAAGANMSARVSGSLASFQELVRRVLKGIDIDPDTGEPITKDMGNTGPGTANDKPPALPAPDKTATDIMRNLQDIVDRPLTDQEKEIVNQEIKKA